MPLPERIELQDPSGSVMADLQAGLATLGPKWGLKQLVDIEPEQARDDLARLSAAALSIVAQAARGEATPVPSRRSSRAKRGRPVPDPVARRARRAVKVQAIDTYWICTAEHGLNASTFTARIVASTGADCAAACRQRSGRCRGRCTGRARAGAADAGRGRGER